jgi:hypothetical protein
VAVDKTNSRRQGLLSQIQSSPGRCTSTNFGQIRYVLTSRGRAALHDCAQVERDNLELHDALATAIHRLRVCGAPTGDLFAVLDRTAGPSRPRR